MPTEAPPAPPPAPTKPSSKPGPEGKAGGTGDSGTKAPPPPLNSLSMYDELRQIAGDNKESAEEKEKAVNKPAKAPTKESEAPTKPEKAPSTSKLPDEAEPDKDADLEHKDETGKTPATPTKDEPKELRKAYESTKKERDLLKAEIEALKKQSPKENPELAATTERLTKEEKRRQELEEEIKHLNYERSPEYKEKFQDPINKAYQHACEEIKEYIVTEDNGNERQATVEDFSAVMRLPPGEVVSRTKAWFGDAAPEVRALRRNLLDLDRKAAEAVKEYKDKGAEIENSRTAEQAQNRQKAEALWDQKHKEAVEKYPQFFAPKDGDDEANKLLESGYKMADLHFSIPKDMPIEKRVDLAAQVRHRVAGFARVVLENKRLQEKLTAVEAELEEFRQSEPDKGDGERVPTNQPKTWEEELRGLAGKVH